MRTFPMFLTMAGRRVVIAGGGEQAAQKCRLMLKTDAAITILAPTLEPELAALAAAGRVDHRPGPIGPQDFAHSALVFVATGCPGLDSAVHALAKAGGALVNVVDRPDLCDALTPSIVDRDPVVVAIGTEGTAPVLGRQIKSRIETMLEPRLGALAASVGRLRAHAAARLQPAARRALWRWVFADRPRERFRAGAEREGIAAIKAAIDAGGAPPEMIPPVSLVGAGAGSADLITLRGVQRLQEADIIFYDRLLDPGILELARRDAERVAVGKAPGCTAWPQDRINGVLVAAARQGKRVVRLKCGDVGIFARGADEAHALRKAGIGVEIVPGVTAASVAAAATGQCLTARGVTDTVVLTTATCQDGDPGPDFRTHLVPGAAVAVYMGARSAGRLGQAVRAAFPGAPISAEVICHAGGPAQRHFRTDPAGLQALADAGEIQNPAIVVFRHPKDARAGAMAIAAE